MNPFGTRARADELAALLDGGVVTLSRGAYDAPALALVERLRTTGAALGDAVAPRTEFRTALRTRLLAVAAVQGIGVPVAEVPAAPRTVSAVTWAQAASARRGLGVAAGAMASVVAVTGVAVASQRSLPGDPFYGAKQATEGVQLRFTDGDVAKGTLHLEFAETRLREVRALTLGRDQLQATSALVPVAASASTVAESGSLTGKVQSALADMDAETGDGRALLEEAFRDTGEVEPLRVLASFAKRQMASLESVLPSLPTAARARAQESLAMVTTVAQQTDLKIALGTCGEACNPQGAGPGLPTASPEPVPGTSAAPTTPTATDEPSCGECGAPTPAPEPGATSEPTTEPTAAPSGEPSGQPSSSPSASPTPAPQPSSVTPTTVPVPTVVPLPSGVPTVVPLPPVVVPTGVPTLPLAAPAPAS